MELSLKSLKLAWTRHELRAGPSGLNFVLADGIEMLNPKHWDDLVANGSFFMQRGYRRLLERHAPSGMQMRYALVYRGDKPIVALAAQVIVVGGDQLANLPNSTIRKRALEQVKIRLLVCGSLVSSGFHGLAFAPDEASSLLWHGVTEALYRIRRADRLNGQIDYVMVKDLSAAQALNAAPLLDFSYRPMKTEAEMVMPLRASWKTMDDYLADLTSNYRSKAKKLIKQIDEAGYRLEHLSSLDAHDARLHALYTEVESRASTRLSALPPGYFAALAKHANPEQFRCTVIRNDQAIVGFITVIKDAQRALAYYVGFDYGVNAELPLYLRLLQSVIETAIEWQCEEVSIGRTAAEPKAGLGAVAHDSQVFLRHRNAVVNALVRKIFQRVQPQAVPERRPFKEAKN